jgi:ribokinase
MSVLVIGSVNRDYVCRVSDLPRQGETVIATDMDLGNGGKGANQAVASAKLGVDTRLVACIGADPYGQALLSDLINAGVETDEIVVLDDTSTGMAFVMVAEDGENSIVVAPGANAQLGPDLARAAVRRRLGPGEVMIVQSEIPVPSVEAAVDEASTMGGRVVLNLGPYIEISDDTLCECDPLVVNEVEARDLLKVGLDAVADPFEMARQLATRAKSAVITLGGRGAIVAAAGDTRHVPARVVAVVDSTGAGDAFTGALAAALCQGYDLLPAVRRGVAAGTFAVTRAGVQLSYPTEDQLPPI